MPNKEITTKWEFDLQSRVSLSIRLDVYVTLKHSWTQDTFQAKQKEICLEDAQALMFSYHIQSKLSFFLWWWKHYLNLITLLVRFCKLISFFKIVKVKDFLSLFLPTQVLLHHPCHVFWRPVKESGKLGEDDVKVTRRPSR